MPVALLRMIRVLSGPQRRLGLLWCLQATLGSVAGFAQPLGANPNWPAHAPGAGVTPPQAQGTPDWGMAAGLARQRLPTSRIAGQRGGVDYRLDYRTGPESGADADAPGSVRGPGSVDGRLGWQFKSAQRLELTGTLERDPDRSPSGATAAQQRKRALEAAWLADWSGRYSTRLSLHGSQQQAALRSGPDLVGEQQHGYTLENRWKQGRHTWTAGAQGDNGALLRGGPGRSHEQDVVSLAHVYERSAQSLALELAYTRSDEFGAYRSGGVSWDYAIVPQWRVSAVADSALDIPTLYQRTSRPGAAARRPQANRRVELHLDWEHDARAWGLAVYRRHQRELSSLASADSCPGLAGCGAAASPTLLQGVTVSARGELGGFRLGGAMDLQQAVDADSRLLLPRHARQALKLDGSTRLGRWQIGPQWQLVGRRFADASQHTALAGYGRLDVQASARFAPAWELVLKVDNAADRKYRLSSSQVTAGRAWSVQLHWVPR